MTEWIVLLMEEILHQLRLVGVQMIFSFFSPGGCLGFLTSTACQVPKAQGWTAGGQVDPTC